MYQLGLRRVNTTTISPIPAIRYTKPGVAMRSAVVLPLIGATLALSLYGAAHQNKNIRFYAKWYGFPIALTVSCFSAIYIPFGWASMSTGIMRILPSIKRM